MKENLKDENPPKKVPALFALVAVLALGVSAVAYDEVHQKISAGEQDLVMADKLNEVARLQALLAQLNSGHVDDAKQTLKLKIAEDIAQMKPLVAASSHDAADYAHCVLAQIDRYQKAHPDGYLTSTASPASEKSKSETFGRQVVTSKLAGQ